MPRTGSITKSIGIGMLAIGASLAFAQESSCVDCHQDAGFYSVYPKLFEYYQDWQESPHRDANVSCEECHGGDARAERQDDAHIGVLSMNDADSLLHFQRQPDTCGQCHRAIRNQFTQSAHYAALMGQRAAPTCTTCHPAMSRRPELRTIVLNACRNCHGEGNSKGLVQVSDQAERVFWQLNIVGGLLGWTRVHYESREWPDGSMGRVIDLEDRHQAIIDRVHQFDLGDTEVETSELLVALQDLFEAARRAQEADAGENGNEL